MEFHDPQRPRLGNDRPTWLPPAKAQALPGLWLEPLQPITDGLAAGASSWLVMLLLDGSWRSRELAFHELPSLFRDWETDPEQALLAWFGCQPPSGTRQNATRQSTSRQSEAATTASADELGL